MDQEQVLEFLKKKEGEFYSLEDIAYNLKSKPYTIRDILYKIINNDINNSRHIIKKTTISEHGSNKCFYSFNKDNAVLSGFNEINNYRKNNQDYKNNNDIILLLILDELRKINLNLNKDNKEKL